MKKKKKKIKSFHQIAEELIIKLNEHQLGAYIWCKAATGSAYIRFEDARMCSIRIGNHDGKEKYKYKYNLRSDIPKSYMEKEGQVWRLYYTLSDIDSLIHNIIERRKRVGEWTGEAKHQYGIPKHLRES